jgi:hypothetical protein
MNQQQFQRIKAGKSQNERVLLCLQEHANQWVAMPLLARIGSGKPKGFCMVHSRVADLRKRGYVIQQSDKREGHQIHSAYKLVTPSGQVTEPPQNPESTGKEPATV